MLESYTEKEIPNRHDQIGFGKWVRLVERIKNGGQGHIGIPEAAGAGGDVRVSVAKARFSRGNSLPDPWLVLVKSAINYSAFRGTKLMPSCLPDPDGSSDGEINTSQGIPCADDQLVDHAYELSRSRAENGVSVEMFNEECESTLLDYDDL